MVSFVSLTWNSELFINSFVLSVNSIAADITLELIVVDNGSEDTSPALLLKAAERSSFPLDVIALDVNRGTTVSRNLALRKARGEYIVILDSDTEFNSNGFNGMITYLAKHPEIGLLVPKLVLPHGSHQNSCKRFPTLQDKLIKLVGILMPFSVANGDFYNNFDFTQPQEVDTAISAFWLFRRDLLDKVGYMDENIFYAPEDVDFSLRVWLAGKTVHYYPYFKVVHHTKQITHSRPFDSVSRSHLRDLWYYFRKHGYLVSYRKVRRMVDNVRIREVNRG